MNWTEGVSIDGYRVQCKVIARGGDYRVRVTTRKRGAGLGERVVVAPSPLVFETQEEAERHARYLMMAVKGVEPSGKPQYTVL
ncbi:hypothetical protein [Bordetella genomosp. 9]|uniref:Uncharacterized protein n=1 Tax=Bordetella genomosp. 9 TaxID=1416803 RepID=A0A1W6Z2U1_9BORD|nr:hypothetical protein [Bordetella genomosp. 9]ARP87494.1 hypothetical protein CAL13_15735 [Bordetella genomosp. 9]